MTRMNKMMRRLSLLLLIVICGWLPMGAAQADTVTYYHTDALGTPVMESNAAGQVTYAREHRPYGEQTLGAAKHGPGFTGHVGDADTGLTYMQARYYDPLAGRFLSNDPVAANLGTGANFNRYWYANNNPYRFVDPDGRQTAKTHKDDTEDQRKAALAERSRRESVGRIGSGAGATMAIRVAATTTATAGGIGVLATLGSIAIGAAIPNTMGNGELSNATRETAAALEATAEPESGQTIYRIWGGRSGPFGQSWTPVNPIAVRAMGLDYRDLAGLPPWNTGMYLSVATLINPAAVIYAGPAAPFGDKQGGMPEYLIQNPQANIRVENVFPLTEPF